METKFDMNTINKRIVCITTADNPYSPIDDFQKWYDWDELAGYHTCELLARMAKTSDRLMEHENKMEIEQVIDEIIANNPTKMYVKVVGEED